MDEEDKKSKKSWGVILQEQIDRKNVELTFKMKTPMLYDPGWFDISPTISDANIDNALEELQNIKKAREIIEEHEEGHRRIAAEWSSRSDAVQARAVADGFEVVHIRLSKLEEEDLCGIPNIAKDFSTNWDADPRRKAPLFFDEVGRCSHEWWRAMHPLVQSTGQLVQSARRVEAPCKLCTRQNDIGSKKCWWCEVSDPVC